MIQSILVPKSLYNLDQAKQLIKEMGFLTSYRGKGVDETENYWRFRQESPKQFKRFFIKRIKFGLMLVIGIK